MMAPAHPHATGVAMYPALFFLGTHTSSMNLRQSRRCRIRHSLDVFARLSRNEFFNPMLCHPRVAKTMPSRRKRKPNLFYRHRLVNSSDLVTFQSHAIDRHASNVNWHDAKRVILYFAHFSTTVLITPNRVVQSHHALRRWKRLKTVIILAPLKSTFKIF